MLPIAKVLVDQLGVHWVSESNPLADMWLSQSLHLVESELAA